MSTPSRSELAVQFLSANGWAGVTRIPLAGDASFRRYERLQLGNRRGILMDAPPEHENVRPFLDIARLLGSLDLSAPRVLGADRERGFVLLEDLGDATFMRVLREGGDERGLYTLAIDTLIALHRRLPPTALAALPRFDDARAIREVTLLLDWYWPARHGSRAPQPIRDAFEAAWRAVLPARHCAPDSIALFDFHVDNLMLLDDRSGVGACGLLDFQDAVRAPVTLDLVSLLEDVRRVVPEEIVRDMIARYLEANPHLREADFATSYAVLGAQRNTRIAGTFARLSVRDGKSAYQRFMPRVWELVARDVEAPALTPVRDWYERYLPPEHRGALSAG